ncbi:MAG TPA: ribose-5-phosphate isomerase RpiA [Polyangiaceae bacterium]|nr:ribose-5-phosphate isomerase RpiA [Polyangiaceae bacterium]
MTEAKRQAAREALAFLPERGVVGLGSGSTAELFIEEVGRLVAAGRSLYGVPTSDASRRQAAALRIPLLPDSGPWPIDVCVDGADEVSAALDLIKGGGGCHSREKIVNAAARTNVIVVDESKLSQKLGERWAVPVEVLTFGAQSTRRRLEQLGQVKLRERDGRPFLTDAGNYIFDVRAGVIEDPAALDHALRAIPGVVETGLFIARADVVVVAGPGGVRRLERARAAEA